MVIELIIPLAFVLSAGLLWGTTAYLVLTKRSAADVATAFGVATIVTLWYFLILLTNICSKYAGSGG